MKNSKLALLFLIVVLTIALTACGFDSKPKNALEKIQSDGVLTIALSPDYRPMEFVDSTKTGQDRYIGFDVSLAKYLAEELGVSLEIQAMNFEACQTAVLQGDVPMSISGYSWTETRSELFDISDFYYAGKNEIEQVLLIRAEDLDKFTKPDDFDQIDIGSQEASLQLHLIEEQLPNAHIVPVKEIKTGIQILKDGTIDAFAVSNGNADQIINKNPDLVICRWKFEVKTEYQNNVILIQKDEPELLAAVNNALAKAYNNGLYSLWYEEALELANNNTSREETIYD